ncbi:hypothetical protein M0G43_01680 [Subsaxibacter sp. CAU 1640]|uniref:hypothetical protein n=1 Tax=Subsaxibacter sp. CAU 1640 TaxID=2933271 RepID=UPI002006A7F0|nr:hypothetical protein [Subsaxibacter sp. CAU 1640]MCK7589275.1 hypothetical protein [Subsaxibacter sp. CAU 1640]
MKTAEIEFLRAIYSKTSSKVNDTIIEYNLLANDEVIDEPLFTPIVRLELDNGFHDRSRYFDYWLYFRNDTNWKRCARTGLAKTDFNYILEGNISRELNLSTKTAKGKNFETPQHLVIVQSADIHSYLIVDIFKDFYIRKKQILKHFIKDHIKEHPATKKEPLNSSLVCSNVCNNGPR